VCARVCVRVPLLHAVLLTIHLRACVRACVCVYVRAANAGDARIMLVKRSGETLQLSVDHVPDDEEERNRIEQFNPNPKMPLVQVRVRAQVLLVQLPLMRGAVSVV